MDGLLTMNQVTGDKRPRSAYHVRLAVKVALLYVLFGAIWIVVSSNVAAFLSPDKDTLLRFEKVKELLFVAVSACLIVTWIHRLHRQQRTAQNAALHLVEHGCDLALLVCPVNGRILRHYGDPRPLLGPDAKSDTLRGRSLQQLHTSQGHYQNFWRQMQQSLHESERFQALYPLPDKCRKRYAQWTISRDENGQLICLIHDMTAQVDGERFRRKLDELFERTPDLICLFSPQLLVTYINPALGTLTGQPLRTDSPPERAGWPGRR